MNQRLLDAVFTADLLLEKSLELFSCKTLPEEVLREKSILSRERALLIARDEGYRDILRALHFLESHRLAPSIEYFYFVCRIIDDIADGDRELPPEFDSFEDLVCRLKLQVQGEPPLEGSDLSLLLYRTLERFLSHRSERANSIRIAFCSFLDSMKLEYERRQEVRVFSRRQLRHLYRESFS